MIEHTQFPHKIIHLGTWCSFDGSTVNQIDHVLVLARHSSSITDVRSCKGPSCYSDQNFVKAVLREQITNLRKPIQLKRKEWNTDKLLGQQGKLLYQTVQKEKLEQQTEGKPIEEDRIKLTSALKEAADEDLRERKKVRNEDWFGEDCKEAVKV